MLSAPANLAHSINGRFSFMEKWIQKLQADINFVNEQLSAINAKNIQQDTAISAINNKDIEQDLYISDINDKDIAQDSYISAINNMISTINDKDIAQDSYISAIQSAISDINNIDTKQDSYISAIQSDILNIYGNISTINDKDISQDSYISAIQSAISDINSIDTEQYSYISAIQSDILNIYGIDDSQDASINTINNTLSSLPGTLFDIIYPIGSIYTTITANPPPNIVTDEDKLTTIIFSPTTINDNGDYWKGRLAKWELLESGRFLRNLGPSDINLLETTTGGTNQVASHTHTVGGNIEYLYGARTNLDAGTYTRLFDSDDQSNKILNATASTETDKSGIYPEKVTVASSTASILLGNTTYTKISFDPTQIQINDVNPSITEQIPPFQYVYIYKRVAKET